MVRNDIAVVGESLEKKIQRLMENKEPLDGSSPLTYTERKDGVLPATNIRTDKWDLALDGMNTVHQVNNTNREIARGERSYDTMTPEEQQAFNKKYPTNKFAKAEAQAAAVAQK